MNRGKRLVIVGGGPAGLATARAYRESGGQAEVVLLAAESHPPYNRPPLTKEYLRGEVDRGDLPIQQPGWFRENGIDLRLATRAQELDVDRRVVRTGSEKLAYDACVIATGSEPIRLPVPGGDDPDIRTMRTIADSEILQKLVVPGSRAVVIGSGFIGCEAAASLSMRGARVTLVSMEEAPQQERLGEEAGGRIRSWLEGYGVDLRLGTGVEEIGRRKDGFTVGLEGEDEVEADVVLFGTGVSARIGLAEDAGIETKDGGIVCDSSMRTSEPGVFAVGDIAFALNESAGRRLRVEHWGDALEHGRIAGTVLAGDEAAWSMAPGFWSTIGDKTLKYWAWGDGWDDLSFEEDGDSFTVRYGKDGVLVGVLAHGADEDYEKGREEIERGVPLRG
ncbi:MAG TPA: FAD-dependent oxidoreductase [Rubrobacteraceae bacterium]|nr:FAD-dependent oxidoreductase [Rubrobacteraceae bacterium]